MGQIFKYTLRWVYDVFVMMIQKAIPLHKFCMKIECGAVLIVGDFLLRKMGLSMDEKIKKDADVSPRSGNGRPKTLA